MACMGEVVIRLEDTPEFLAWRERQEAWQKEVESVLGQLYTMLRCAGVHAPVVRVQIDGLAAIRAGTA